MSNLIKAGEAAGLSIENGEISTVDKVAKLENQARTLQAEVDYSIGLLNNFL